MAKVKRFIYNSDFMTIAKVGHEEITATIPAKQAASYGGQLIFPIDIPKQSWARMQLKYQGQRGPLQWVAFDSYVFIEGRQSNRQIFYTVMVLFKDGQLVLDYFVDDTSAQAVDNPILINSQTFTIILDFLQQPNT